MIYLEKYILKNNVGNGVGNDFLVRTTKAQATKVKIQKYDCIKLILSYTAKKMINRIKKQPTEWEKIFENHPFSSGSISRIYKELKTFMKTKT